MSGKVATGFLVAMFLVMSFAYVDTKNDTAFIVLNVHYAALLVVMALREETD